MDKVIAPTELDSYSASAFRQQVQDRQGAVVVDMSQCEFMDSSGISALLACAHLLEDRGDALVLESVQPQPLRVLTLSGLHDHLLG